MQIFSRPFSATTNTGTENVNPSRFSQTKAHKSVSNTSLTIKTEDPLHGLIPLQNQNIPFLEGWTELCVAEWMPVVIPCLDSLLYLRICHCDTYQQIGLPFLLSKSPVHHFKLWSVGKRSLRQTLAFVNVTAFEI